MSVRILTGIVKTSKIAGQITINFNPHTITGEGVGVGLREMGAIGDFSVPPGKVVSLRQLEVSDKNTFLGGSEIDEFKIYDGLITTSELKVKWSSSGGSYIREISYLIVGDVPGPADWCGNRHLLSEFGPYDTAQNAEATLKQALTTIIGEGGGVLCIPHDAPQDFYPRNLEQNDMNDPAVTIFDYRQGTERLFVPPMGTLNTEGGGRGCHLIERDLKQDLGWQGVFSTQYIQSRYLGGASSYDQKLSKAFDQGVDQKLYVPTHRGLFQGQSLLVTGGAGGGETVTVKDLGVDNYGPYFEADENLMFDHPANALVYNKNVVNGLTVEDSSNCDNQSMSLIVDRKTYGVGDSFGISTQLSYQSDIISGGGDEGGVGISSQIVHDLDCFRGKVDSWKPQTRELVYKAGMQLNSQKLGTSRPLINMSQVLFTAGKVLVTPPNTDNSKIIGLTGVGWDQSVVGCFIAINDPSEHYGPPNNDEFNKTIHRWWHISALEDGENGYMHLYVERHGWGVNTRTGPSLFRYENYTIDDHVVELDYIIARGAWISEVRDAVAGNTPGFGGQATVKDKRTLVLAPSYSINTLDHLKIDDEIINPPGPDPWLPTAFRARHFNNYPGLMKGASFMTENFGKTQVGAGLAVSGPGGTLNDVIANQKDGEVSFETGLYILAATNSAIRIRGPVRSGAVDFWQPEGNEQKIRWFRVTVFIITEDTLDYLQSEGVPQNVLQQLAGLLNKRFVGERAFLDILKTTIGEQQTNTYRDLILKHTDSISGSPSTLHARPDTGDFIFEGSNVGIGTAEPKSQLHVKGLPEYADNAAAKAAGLTAGAFYRTSDFLKVVH